MLHRFSKLLCIILSFCLAFFVSVPAWADGSWFDEYLEQLERDNKLPHTYLRGYVSETTGEVQITGLKKELNRDSFDEMWKYDCIPETLIIPDEIEGHPVTSVCGFSAEDDAQLYAIKKVVIGNNVRVIGQYAFHYNKGLRTVQLGKNVQGIGAWAFAECDYMQVIGWGDSLQRIEEYAFYGSGTEIDRKTCIPPLPDTVEYIGQCALICPKDFVIPASVTEVHADAFGAMSLFFLSKNLMVNETETYKIIWPDVRDPDPYYVYCYAGSGVEENAKIHGYTYYLIDGDSLLWDGEAVEGNVLHLDRGMTEAELRAHLSIDGDSSEIQMDGLKDGRVVNGTTVTLFHKIAQAPGKVYTVEKEPEIVSVSVETLPKTNYFYKEAFDPDGLSLRATYDDGTEKVVTDGYTLSGTELKLGTNTITATYENVSTTFPVTVRYAWWQHLIRIFLFGFLWY